MAQLLNKGRALFNQSHLVSTQQAQFLNEWLFWPKRLPAMTIDAQSVGKTPRIQLIIFDPTRGFALAISLGAFGIKRITIIAASSSCSTTAPWLVSIAKGIEPYAWSFSRNFFQPNARCSTSKSSITLPA